MNSTIKKEINHIHTRPRRKVRFQEPNIKRQSYISEIIIKKKRSATKKSSLSSDES